VGEAEGLLEGEEDFNYQICQMELSTFMWAVEDKLLSYIAVKLNLDEFDEENFKTICYRCRMTACDRVFIIAEQGQQSTNQQNTEGEAPSKEDPNCSKLLHFAMAAGFRVVRTANPAETMKTVVDLTHCIFSKLKVSENNPQKKEKKSSTDQTE
jgi:hypothetical protein